MADDLKRRFSRPDNAYVPGAAAEQRAPSSDPLAELARLIGQNDVFDQMRRDASRAPSESGPDKPRAPYEIAAGERRPQYEEPPETQADYAARIYGRDHQPAYDKNAAAAAPVGYAEPYYADGPADPYPTPLQGSVPEGGYDEPYEETAEPPPVERRRSGLAIAAALVGIAAVGTAGAFGYRTMTGGGDSAQPPVIAADRTPAKIVPAPTSSDGQAGRVGFDRSDKPQQEKVVPREEQPIEMRETKAPSPKMMGPNITGTTGIGAPAQGGTPLASSSSMQPLPANPNEPKKVRTFAVRPDGSLASEPVRPQGAGATRGVAPTQITPTRPNPTPRPGASLPPGQGALAMASPGEASRPSAAAPTQTASIRPLDTPVATRAAAPIANGSHVVQLASQKSEIEAQASFRSLQAKYPGVLAGRQPLIRKVELGERGTYYRAQVGPFASADQATELCSNLKAAGGQCIVQRN